MDDFVRRILLSFFIAMLLFSCYDTKESDNSSVDHSSESCMVCHSDLKGFSDAHDPQAIGCSSCHLGNVSSEDKDIAHKNMIKIPGNLSNASKTCSTTQCHKSEFERISNSLMTTNSGIVSIDKYAFEEVPHSDTFFHIENIKGTAADKHLKNLCFKCHLGYEKKHYGAVDQLSRGGACLACHLDYHWRTEANINDNFHPSLNLNVDNGKCFGCHSRSGRISTNYEGWYETLFTAEDIKDSNNFRVLSDGRIFGNADEDVHHKAGLLCIDCHMSQEIMGDGKRYKHENEAVKIQCKDCHVKDKYNIIDRSKSGEIATLDYALRNYKYSSKSIIVTEVDSIPLVNTYFDENGKAYLIGKINQEKHPLNPIPNKCQKDQVHTNVDCSTCHTSWAPTCIGCHTAYDKNIRIKNGSKGKWYEMVGDFGKSKPVMGVSYSGKKKKIIPSIPGMIMTLDKSDFNGDKSGADSIFLRWFAPVFAHTTISKARSCISCHINPAALGYGKGELKYIYNNFRGYWKFESLYSNSAQDNLPQDAWIGFLQDIDKDKKYSAHQDFYPLSLTDQKKILTVGACLSCHKKDKDFEDKLTNGNYKKLYKERSEKCKLPF